MVEPSKYVSDIKHIIITGLPAMGKTLASEVVQALGYDFGSEGRLKPALEHNLILNWGTQILKAIGGAANPVLTPWDISKADIALKAARNNWPDEVPQAIKLLIPGIAPVLEEVLDPEVIIWCQRHFQPWSERLEELKYSWRGTEPRQSWHDSMLSMKSLKADGEWNNPRRLVIFDVDFKDFRGEHPITIELNRALSEILSPRTISAI